ncbi:MAG: acetyl-CoA hydrolase/transferase family protein [Trebonia sp.]
MADEVLVSAAFRGVAPGARILAAPCCGTPETLLRELGRYAERTDGLQLTTGLTFGSFPHLPAVRAGRLRYRTWHPSGPARDLVAGGLADYLPLRASDVRAAIRDTVDVLLLRVSPPGRDGWCSTGPTASFTRAAVETARLVIAEVDPDLPRTTGDSRVHLSEIGRLIAADDPTPSYPRSARTDPRAEVIAGHVAGLIPDGATVQLGLGSVTEAVGELLGRKHGTFRMRVLGVLTEQMIPLAESSSGTARAVELIGGPKLMEWANRNTRVEMTSSDRVHDPVFLSKIDTFVSVSPAASVDLTGQVVSDMAGGCAVSGIGGGADSFEGAHLSRGGLRILALTSTTERGVPTIVAEHPAGTQVTIPRHSVDVVVTEHGVAWLRGRTLDERREAMVAIAGGGTG